MSDHLKTEYNDGLVVQEAKPKLKKPSMYKVVLLNDDYTPMDFVVEILEYFFNKTREESIRIMMQVHVKGKGICGVYSKDVAETKVEQVNSYSRSHEHPLMCMMENENNN